MGKVFVLLVLSLLVISFFLVCGADVQSNGYRCKPVEFSQTSTKACSTGDRGETSVVRFADSLGCC